MHPPAIGMAGPSDAQFNLPTVGGLIYIPYEPMTGSDVAPASVQNDFAPGRAEPLRWVRATGLIDGDAITAHGLATERGTLGDAKVVPASMRQLQRLVRDCTDWQRPIWQAVLHSITQGGMVASAKNQPGQPLNFGHETQIDGRRYILGVVAGRYDNGSMGLLKVVAKDVATGAVTIRALNTETADVQAALQSLESRAAVQGSGTVRAYMDTAGILDIWMHNTGCGRVLDVKGNIERLLRNFAAHVGATSYVGSNATVVLEALAGMEVQEAPWPRILGALRSLGTMSNPLGLNESERQKIAEHDGGRATLAYIETNWASLLGWLSRAQILRIVSRGTHLALQSLREVVPVLMPAFPQGQGMTLRELVKIATFGCRPALEALRDEGMALRHAGVSAEDIKMIAYRQSSGGVIRAIAAKLLDIQQGRIDVSFETLMAAALRERGAAGAVKKLGLQSASDRS